MTDIDFRKLVAQINSYWQNYLKKEIPRKSSWHYFLVAMSKILLIRLCRCGRSKTIILVLY